MKLYAIRDWDRLFENSRSRQYARLSWVLIPNKMDGEHFLAIMRHPDGAQIFAAFVLMLETASTCHPRGTLARSNGSPHTADSLASKTRAPVAWFKTAFAYLEAQTDWLVVKDVPTPKGAVVSPPVQELYTEQKERIEQNKRIEGGEEGENQYARPKCAPDLKTVQSWAGMLAIPPAEAEQFWHIFEATGWRDRNGNVIVSARSKLASWWADRRQRKAGQLLGTGSAPGVTSPAEMIKQQKELERVEARLQRLRDVHGKGKWEEKPRLEFSQLKARREELIKLLGFAV